MGQEGLEVDTDVALRSCNKSGLPHSLDGSGDGAWVKKELNADPDGRPLDANGQPIEPDGDDGSDAGEDDPLIIDIVTDEDDTGVAVDESDIEGREGGAEGSDGTEGSDEKDEEALAPDAIYHVG